MSPNDPLQGAAWSMDELRRGLALKRLGCEFHYFAEIDSTNTYARQLAEAGAREGEIVIAEAQTQGRGRLGRRWQSPPFANLYFSVILRPQLPPMQAPQITLTAAVALAETVGFVSSPNPPRSNGPTTFSSTAGNWRAFSPKPHATRIK